jgi:hypothetical protein
MINAMSVQQYTGLFMIIYGDAIATSTGTSLVKDILLL